MVSSTYDESLHLQPHRISPDSSKEQQFVNSSLDDKLNKILEQYYSNENFNHYDAEQIKQYVKEQLIEEIAEKQSGNLRSLRPPSSDFDVRQLDLKAKHENKV